MGKNIITVLENGPLQVEGDFRVYDTIGQLLEHEGLLLLCRCGASKTKPLCDGSHGEIEFRDCCQVDNSRDEKPEADTTLVISCRPNGMLVVKGPVTIIGPDGKTKALRNKAALCRCGASRNKPFCDISHKKAGFIDDALLSEDEDDEQA